MSSELKDGLALIIFLVVPFCIFIPVFVFWRRKRADAVDEAVRMLKQRGYRFKFFGEESISDETIEIFRRHTHPESLENTRLSFYRAHGSYDLRQVFIYLQVETVTRHQPTNPVHHHEKWIYFCTPVKIPEFAFRVSTYHSYRTDPYYHRMLTSISPDTGPGLPADLSIKTSHPTVVAKLLPNLQSLLAAISEDYLLSLEGNMLCIARRGLAAFSDYPILTKICDLYEPFLQVVRNELTPTRADD